MAQDVESLVRAAKDLQEFAPVFEKYQTELRDSVKEALEHVDPNLSVQLTAHPVFSDFQGSPIQSRRRQRKNYQTGDMNSNLLF